MKKSLFGLLIILIFAGTVFTCMTNKVTDINKVHAETTYDSVTTLEQLKNTPVEDIVKWSNYDSRKYDIVTSVKDQGQYYLCWSYAITAAVETSILRHGYTGVTKDNLDIDEIRLAKAFFGKWDDPLDIADISSGTEGNNNTYADNPNIWDQMGSIEKLAQFLTRWQGIYDEGSSDDPIMQGYGKYRIAGYAKCNNDVSEIKKLIATYGGVAVEYYGDEVGQSDYVANKPLDHASLIVGWDDNRRVTGATKNGAWIVKNSYGPGAYDKGYIYLGYESKLWNMLAIDVVPEDADYDWVYNYNGKVVSNKNSTYAVGASEVSKIEYAIINKAINKTPGMKESLNAVSVGGQIIDKNQKMIINVEVYSDLDPEILSQTDMTKFSPKTETPAATATYECDASGIYIIDLNKEVPLNRGQDFSIVVKIQNGILYSDDMFTYSPSKLKCYIYDTKVSGNGEFQWAEINARAPGEMLPTYSSALPMIRALTRDSDPSDEENEEITGILSQLSGLRSKLGEFLLPSDKDTIDQIRSIIEGLDDNIYGLAKDRLAEYEQIIDDFDYLSTLVDETDALVELKNQLGEEITIEDYETINEIAKFIAKYDRKEHAFLQDKLAEYDKIISDWNTIADMDENIINDAKTAAEAPFVGLLITSTALAALAFIALKGVRLI